LAQVLLRSCSHHCLVQCAANLWRVACDGVASPCLGTRSLAPLVVTWPLRLIFGMSWMHEIVRHTRDALFADDGEDPDETLAKAFGNVLEGDEDDEDPYKALARVDQVIHFFEYDAPNLEGYISEDTAFAEELESKRVTYYNMVNSVDVQHRKIAHMVDELLALRTRLRELRCVESERPRRKEILLEINRVKLDIGDVKNKRYFKDRARKEAMADIVPMIVNVKTARLLAEQEYAQKATSHAGVDAVPKSANANGLNGKRPEPKDESGETTVLTKSSGARRRKHVYSDKELNKLLRDDD